MKHKRMERMRYLSVYFGFTSLTLAFILMSLFNSGCGGGGGGSTSATPAASSLSLEVGARVGTSGAYVTTQLEAGPGQTVQIRAKLTNTGGAVTNPIAGITLPDGVTLVANSVEVMYGVDSQTKAVPDAITSTSGTPIGINVDASSYIYIKYKVTATTSGLKTITTRVAGADPKETKVNVSGQVVCQSITQPTCGTGTHLVAGAADTNGCATLGSCVQNSCSAITQPTCQAGYHRQPNENQAGCPVADSCIIDACATVTQPTCQAGYHRQANPNVGGCAVADSCVADSTTYATFQLATDKSMESASAHVTCGSWSKSWSLSVDNSGWVTIGTDVPAGTTCTATCPNNSFGAGVVSYPNGQNATVGGTVKAQCTYSMTGPSAFRKQVITGPTDKE